LRKIWGNVKISKNFQERGFFAKKMGKFVGCEIFSAFLKKMHFLTTYVKISAHLKHFQAFLRRIKEYVKISKKMRKKIVFRLKTGKFLHFDIISKTVPRIFSKLGIQLGLKKSENIARPLF
jgi:hypothetical protein